MSNEQIEAQCPFCPSGTKTYFAVRDVGWLEDREKDRRIVVVCSKCGAQGPAFGLMSFNNESTAAQYWNTRTRVPAGGVGADLLKLARQIIDVVVKSPCIIETRFFSQQAAADALEAQIAKLLVTATAPTPTSEPEKFGDGHYCTHHPDDPAHTSVCYDRERFFATTPTSEPGDLVSEARALLRQIPQAEYVVPEKDAAEHWHSLILRMEFVVGALCRIQVVPYAMGYVDTAKAFASTPTLISAMVDEIERLRETQCQ